MLPLKPVGPSVVLAAGASVAASVDGADTLLLINTGTTPEFFQVLAPTPASVITPPLAWPAATANEGIPVLPNVPMLMHNASNFQNQGWGATGAMIVTPVEVETK